MKNKIFKTILIVCDVVVLVWVSIITRNWIIMHRDDDNTNHNNNNNNVVVNYQEIRFKSLILQLPDNYQYTKIDDDKMEFKTEKYAVQVELFIDKNNITFNKTADLYKSLKEIGYDVGEYETKVIDKYNVLVFYKSTAKIPLFCYVRYDAKYAYEMTFSSDYEISDDELKDLLDVLLAVKIDSSLTDKYYFVSIY